MMRMSRASSPERPFGPCLVYPLVMCYSLLVKMVIEIVNFPMKNGGSFHSYVKLPECISQVAHAWIVDMLNTDEYSISPKKTG